MFDIGASEIFLIALVALLVLGPERLPKAARFVGLWVRRARAQWYSVKAELENELADEELRRSLHQTQDDLREARDALVQGGADLERQLQDAQVELREGLRAANPLQPASDADADKAPAAPSTTTHETHDAPR